MICIAKFRCQSVKDFGNDCKEVELSPVCADELPENQRFHKYTPSGNLKMTVNNPNVVFKPNVDYFIQFHEANPLVVAE